MATFVQQSGIDADVVQCGDGTLLTPLEVSDARNSMLTKQPQEKLAVLQRKGVEKSILDDIMGSPEDFRALGDSDGENDSDQPSQSMLKLAVDVEKEIPQGDYVQSQGLRENDQSMSSGKVDGALLASERLAHKSDMENGSIQVETNGDRRTSVLHGAGTRFFIIKSLNRHNLEKSVKKGIWATQAMNEAILNEAFENAERVILIFSVNMSGHFQGYAQMMSSIGQRRARVWNETTWGGTFNVDWIRLCDLPFQRTVHLRNPLNSFKPVKISRDCQELTEDIGKALCALIDEGADGEGRIKRKSMHMGDGFSKKVCTERMPWVHSDHYGDARAVPIEGPWTSMMYPYGFPTLFSNGLYNPQVPVNMDGFSAHGSMGHGTMGKCSPAEHHKGFQSRSFMSGSPREDALDRRGNRDQLEGRERTLQLEPAKESSRGAMDCGTAGVPLDDEFLNMTYEEYLQRVGNAGPQHQQAVSLWSRVEEHW